jgi:hypothetical protein
MAAIGIALLVAAYGSGLTGYSLVRGYDMTLGSFWNPVHPGKWNTQLYTGQGVFPDGKTQGKAASSTPAKPTGPGPGGIAIPPSHIR